MKKFIFILTLGMMLSISTFAQETKETQTKPTTITEIERLIDKYTTKVVDATSPSANMLFQQAVKKEIISAKVIIWIASIIIGIMIIITIIIAFMTDNGDTELFSGWCAATVIFLIIGGLFIGCNIVYLSTPEYYAAKDILETLSRL